MCYWSRKVTFFAGKNVKYWFHNYFLVEVRSPSLGVPADTSQIEQPDQQHIWCLQLEIFFELFFQAADNLEMIKKAQEKKSWVISNECYSKLTQ